MIRVWNEESDPKKEVIATQSKTTMAMVMLTWNANEVKFYRRRSEDTGLSGKGGNNATA